MKKNLVIVLLFVLLFISCSKSPSKKNLDLEENKDFNTEKSIVSLADNDSVFYLNSEPVSVENNSGYTNDAPITKKNPHWGWQLGQFYLKGFTRKIEDGNKYIFLKTLDDNVTLGFELFQNIKALDGDEKLSIAEDEKGFEERTGIPMTNFGKGTLIIIRTDYQGKRTEPQIYTDFLEGLTNGANTEINLYEEGDYEIILDYKIKNKRIIGSSYTSYRVAFEISVRNGNCMVFAFDSVTKSELVNKSYTSNGFYLDLAQSRYLQIDIQKEILNSTFNGLVPDTRFNRPAKDGEVFEEEGIYTINVKNLYTNANTQKMIYVGTNGVLKAYVVTGMPIEEIEKELSEGARILPNGMIVKSPDNFENIEAKEEKQPNLEDENITNLVQDQENNEVEEQNVINTPVYAYIIPVIGCFLIYFIRKNGKRGSKN